MKYFYTIIVVVIFILMLSNNIKIGLMLIALAATGLIFYFLTSHSGVEK